MQMLWDLLEAYVETKTLQSMMEALSVPVPEGAAAGCKPRMNSVIASAKILICCLNAINKGPTFVIICPGLMLFDSDP